MVGSVPKQRKFALRLRARGFSDAEIARLRTPLGMPIGADTPEEIAVSAMGELIAARRGASLAQGWTPPLPKAMRAGGRAGDEPAPEPGAPAREETRPAHGTPAQGVGRPGPDPPARESASDEAPARGAGQPAREAPGDEGVEGR
jgi:hypothetical protein